MVIEITNVTGPWLIRVFDGIRKIGEREINDSDLEDISRLQQFIKEISDNG